MVYCVCTHGRSKGSTFLAYRDLKKKGRPKATSLFDFWIYETSASASCMNNPVNIPDGTLTLVTLLLVHSPWPHHSRHTPFGHTTLSHSLWPPYSQNTPHDLATPGTLTLATHSLCAHISVFPLPSSMHPQHYGPIFDTFC